MATPSPKVIVRVFLSDDSFKTLALNPLLPTKKIIPLIAEKLDLKNYKYYALFLVSDGVESCFEDDACPCKALLLPTDTDETTVFAKEHWDARKADWEKNHRFLFKKRLLVKDEDTDPVSTHLEYVQVLADVVSGRYPLSMAHAVNLAGMQMQVNFGDYSPATHKAGFLKDKIQKYIAPAHAQFRRVEEWEADIYAVHQTFAGRTALEMKAMYLAFLQKFYYYGATFFEVANPGNRELPAKVTLAVTADGIHLMRAENKALISSHAFPEIERWAFTSNSFAFMAGTSAGVKEKFQFETKQGGEIARQLQAYVDALLAMYQEEPGEYED